ncbi:MAG: phosphotransferase [Nitriliruptoraceae bacterium]
MSDTAPEPIELPPMKERDLLIAAARAAGAELRSSRLRSVHHRPGRSRSALYDATLVIGEQEQEALLATHTDVRGFPDEALVLGDGDVQAAVWRFPNDPYLPGLPSALSTERVRELLDDLGGPSGDVALRTRTYRPTRRAVVEVEVQGEVAGRIAYLKVLSSKRARSVARRHRTLLAAQLPVPGLIGLAEPQGIVALEALAGLTLAQALAADAPLPDPAEFLTLAERFATSGVDGSRDPRAFADPVRHVPLLAAQVPERAEELAELAAEAAAVTGPVVGVHGDLHAGQLLLGADGAITGVIDIDGAGQGYLAHDAGNLLAHLEAFGDLDARRRDRTHAFAARLRAAYAEVVDPVMLDRASAASWIGLATGAHRAREQGWRDEMGRRIDRAAELLGRR